MRFCALCVFVVQFALMLPSGARAEMSAKAYELRTLYEELQNFKSDPKFHQVGFGACCQFNAWLARVLEINNLSGLNLLEEVGFVPDELRILAREYMRSEGAPTEYTESMEAIFRAGLYE